MLRIARLLATACLLGTVLLPVAAAAQTTPALERVDVALWPEYDQRAMLVIYRVTLSAAASLPGVVEVPIPARIGEPTAVAQQAPDGALILADYALQAADGDWATLTIQAESASLQVEFYDALIIEGASRSYTFTWPAGWLVGELAYEVLEPPGASEMQIDPAPASDRIGSNGLTFYLGSLGLQDGSAEAQVRVGYTKADAGLTVEATPPAAGTVAPAIRAAQPTRGLPSMASLVPWLIGGLGIAMLAAGVVFFVRSRGEESKSRRPRHRGTAGETAPPTSLDASTVFCHSCGNPAGVGDVFCRKCGNRLRT